MVLDGVPVPQVPSQANTVQNFKANINKTSCDVPNWRLSYGVEVSKGIAVRPDSFPQNALRYLMRSSVVEEETRKLSHVYNKAIAMSGNDHRPNHPGSKPLSPN